MAQKSTYDDQQLLLRLAAGDQQAFEQLFCRHWDRVYSASLLMTRSPALADDIAQDVFLEVWKHRDRMSEVANFAGFLHGTVKFMVLKKLRRVKVEEAYRQYLSHRIKTNLSTSQTEASFSFKQLQKSLQQGIARLPPQQRLAFRLSREEGLSHDQISEVMGVNKKTVKDYIVRAIAYLRPYLERHAGCIAGFLIGTGLI